MHLEPIGTIRSCFPEKFGIPRQAGLAPAATAVLKLRNDRGIRESLRGLEAFSHVWVIFLFHGNSTGTPWRPLVRPPRLGGGRKLGVLATRSPHRPNPIGLSAVRLLGVSPEARGGPEIRVSGGDFLDGTPVLDLKPYLPYADSIPRARGAWAGKRPTPIAVSFEPAVRAACRSLSTRHPELVKLIRQVISHDPRPAFQKRSRTSAEYSARLLDLDVHWKVARGRAVVHAIDAISSPS